MVLRALAVALGLSLSAAAQTVLSIEQLSSFIQSSIRLKHPDRQIASVLRAYKLSEKLDDRTIEELQGYGAGPKTLEALRALRDASANLLAPKPPAPKPAPPPAIPPPSSEEQASVISEARENALNYSKTLPDFICTQVTRRSVDPSGLGFFQRADMITARLSYFQQKEDYKVILVNNSPTQQSYESLGGATSRGEFGTILKEIFEPATRARFQWERWTTLRGRRTHVISFRVAQPYSKYSIDYDRRIQIVAGYAGSVYVDKDTNMVVRINMKATEIPPEFPVQEAGTLLDYDYTKIGEQEFLLPLRAVVTMRHDKFLTKNEVEFRMYRKFSTETVITFETPEPLSEDKVREQPPH